MKLPDNVEFVATLPPERLRRFRSLPPPFVGARRGVLLCEGYAITPKRFHSIVATCECSGFTAVRFLPLDKWYGYAHTRCNVCGVSVDYFKRATKGWGYL